MLLLLWLLRCLFLLWLPLLLLRCVLCCSGMLRVAHHGGIDCGSYSPSCRAGVVPTGCATGGAGNAATDSQRHINVNSNDKWVVRRLTRVS